MSNSNSSFEQHAGERGQRSIGPDHEPFNIGTEQGFMSAVYRVLKDFNRPDLIRTNPLINSRLVTADPAASSPSDALRALFHAHCGRLGQSQKYKRYQLVLEQTYLTPLRKQQAVADGLHMSWGTYRRYLGDASRMLAASLWEAECGLQVASRPPAPGTARARPWAALATVIVLAMLTGSGYLYAHRRREDDKPAAAASPAAATSPSDAYAQDLSGTQDLYSVGAEYLDKGTDSDVKRAVHYFHGSVQSDPANPDAWAALAMAYAVWHVFADNQVPDAHYSDAMRAANKALALDPTQPTAHAVLALLHQEHWEWQQAIQEYQLALRLDPKSAVAERWYAKYFWLTGDNQSALQHLRAANAADPLSDVTSANLGRAFAYAGKFNQAENQLRTSIQQSPRFKLNYEYLAETHLAMRRFAQALDDLKAAGTAIEGPTGNFQLMESGVAEAGLGRTNLAKQVLLALQQQSPAHYVSGVLTARLYWALGDKDKCFAELQRAVRKHDDNLMMLSGPNWADVRADARFSAIRKQMELSATGHPIH